MPHDAIVRQQRNNGIEKRFRIRPDLVIEIDSQIIVADTKWKVIDENNPRNNYQISQADMYQLFAYGKKYETKRLMLIYPTCATFQSELKFSYEEGLELVCSPWNFEKEDNLNYQLLSEKVFST